MLTSSIPYLPPLQALRAFEAAARHLSYSRAAQELCLTHGAISQHISRLEGDLGGVRLFVRRGQRMLLTEVGQTLLVEVRRGLVTLADAFKAARADPGRDGARRTLSVSVLPSLAARWLVPKLSRFQAGHPDIDIALRPGAALAAMDGRDGIDLALRYGAGRWPGLQAFELMKSVIFPVASPELLARLAIRAPADLLDAPLLRNPRQPWQAWLRAAGLNRPEPSQGPIYDDAGLLLQAAAAGQGVALAREALAADDLAAGRLVRVGDVEIEDDFGWFVVWREPILCGRGDLEAFARWLQAEAGMVAPRAA